MNAIKITKNEKVSARKNIFHGMSQNLKNISS